MRNMVQWQNVTRRVAVAGLAAVAALAVSGSSAWAQKKPIKVAGIYTVPVEQQWVSRIHKAKVFGALTMTSAAAQSEMPPM